MRALSQNERFIFEEPISSTLPSSSLNFSQNPITRRSFMMRAKDKDKLLILDLVAKGF
jgi:hypothetical protein